MNKGRVAIIGSRDYANYLVFKANVAQFLSEWDMEPIAIVSGGAEGVDTMARRYAQEKKIELIEFLPNEDSKGNRWHERNAEIIDHCDVVIAFPSADGKGTQHAMRLAKEAGKEIKEYWVG